MNNKVKILLVDDLAANLLALDGLLRRSDVVIYSARTGVEALEYMILHDFALALIDVQMPTMSGFELAELMRGMKKTKNVPIIFVTATAKDQSFSFKGYESGAVDFLLKPLDTFAVKSKVNIFIDLYRQKKELKTQLEIITNLVKALNSSKDEAINANASKTEFLANMSHEIRTPIGAILGFIDLLKNPANTDEENLSYRVVVERNSQQLLRLIDDILDLSKVEAGKLTIEHIQFSLTELLVDFTSLMSYKASEKGIGFQIFADTLIPDLICTDPIRLRQILFNVAGNALKFTDKGVVEVRVSFKEPILTIKIKDSGVGISKAQEIKLFKPFAQADNSTTRKFGGTGLGLILSRRLAESLGGKLELVESEKDLGSTFIVEVKTLLLPEAKMVGREALTTIIPATIPNIQGDDFILRGLKVLLVEDSPDNQILITRYLTKVGAIVKIANDGSHGCDLALLGNFDVVLMDIQMPIMDGHDATKKLRLSQYAKPIIALTAHAMKEERAKCFKSGFTDFLTKPIQKDLLIDVLSRYHSPTPSTATFVAG